MTEIRLATSRNADDPSGDEGLLCAALLRRGMIGKPTVWGEPSVGKEGSPVVIRSCWDYHHRPVAFLDWIRVLESRGVTVVNAPALVRWNLDKRYLLDLARLGVATIPTTVVERGTDFDLRGLGRAIAKPTISASAEGAWQSRGTEADQTRFDAQIATGALLVQPYLEEIEREGEVSVVAFDGRISHAVRKRPRAGDWRVQEEHGGRSVLETPEDSLVEFALKALQALPSVPCYARIDGVKTQGGWRLMELELIEPHLFLSLCPASADAFADAILTRLV